jgi:hypothetical protein
MPAASALMQPRASWRVVVVFSRVIGIAPRAAWSLLFGAAIGALDTVSPMKHLPYVGICSSALVASGVGIADVIPLDAPSLHNCARPRVSLRVALVSPRFSSLRASHRSPSRVESLHIPTFFLTPETSRRIRCRVV